MKTKSGIQHRDRAPPPEIQSYRTWSSAASPILNDTPVVYTTYNRTRIRNAHTHTHIYIYILTASVREPRSTGGNTSSNPHVSALIPRHVVNGMERIYQRHGSDQTPTILFESKNNASSHLYNISSRRVFISNSKLRNCDRCNRISLQQLIDSVYWPECTDGPWWSIVVCRLNSRGPSLTVVSIGMRLLSLVTLLLMYLNRLAKRSKYFGCCNI